MIYNKFYLRITLLFITMLSFEACNAEYRNSINVAEIYAFHEYPQIFAIHLPKPKHAVWEIGYSFSDPVNALYGETLVTVCITNNGPKNIYINNIEKLFELSPLQRTQVFKDKLSEMQRGRLMIYAENGDGFDCSVEVSFNHSVSIKEPFLIFVFQRRPAL